MSRKLKVELNFGPRTDAFLFPTPTQEEKDSAARYRVTVVPGFGLGPSVGQTLESMGLKVGDWVTIDWKKLFESRKKAVMDTLTFGELHLNRCEEEKKDDGL